MRTAALVGVLALTIAGSAAAAGGTSIAKAPLVRAGAEETENTSSDTTLREDVGSALSHGCWNDFEYWRLALSTGDKVSISGKATLGADNFAVGVFPAGTTDRTIHGSTSILNAFPDSRVARFTAKTTGTYALVVGPNCYNGTDGQFSFVVTVAHV
jgi:hypothetical protein